MADPYTIKIHVLNGDPEGVRIIDQMNWTGQGIVFPRSDWNSIKNRESFDKPGVYLLVGYSSDEDDLMTVYIGEGDGIRDRIDSHYKNKDFWSWGITFVSTNHSLNKAHVQWLEHALIKRAKQINRCKLSNSNAPNEPLLNEADKADTAGFLKEILQILPLVGIRAFETPKVLFLDNKDGSSGSTTSQIETFDTVVIPAMEEGFEKVFLGENRWYAIRLAAGSIPKIKYIAAYRSAPISSITHLAEVASIELYGETGKYLLNFKEPAREINPVKYDGIKGNQLQGLRYTSKAKLLKATTISDLLPWG
jgi:hypothetical protein